MGMLRIVFVCRLVIFHVNANKDQAMVVQDWVEEEVEGVLAIHVVKPVISHAIALKELVMGVDLLVMVVGNRTWVAMAVDLVAMAVGNRS